MSKTEKTEQPEPSRRRFLHLLWGGLGFIALAELVGVGIAFFRPRASSTQEDNADNLMEVGPVESFAPGSVTAFVRGQFYLSRLKEGGFLAISRRCTHLGCTVPWVSKENKFICPCHGSSFDIAGNVVSPPAPRALDLYPVTIENNIITVDISRKIKRNRFNKSQAAYPARN